MTAGRWLGAGETPEYSAYDEFRTALSDPTLPSDVALIARKFAADELDKLAKETDLRVQGVLSAAVFDALTMTEEQREYMVAMILAEVTA